MTIPLRWLLAAGFVASQFSCLSSSGIPLQDTTASPVPASSQLAPMSGRKGEVVVLVGRRSLDEDNWAPVEDQVAFGLEGNVRLEGNPVSIEFGLQGSFDEVDQFVPLLGDVRATGSTGEIYAGARYNLDFEGAPLNAYFAGGLTFIRAMVEAEQLSTSITVDDDDSSAGAYVHGGVLLRIGESPGSAHAVLGVDLRAVLATDVTLFDVPGDADYTQIAFVIGVGF